MRHSILGFDIPDINASKAWEAGFGSLYWMEGVVTRQRDRHGGERGRGCWGRCALCTVRCVQQGAESCGRFFARGGVADSPEEVQL